jgi:two-component system LytT family response regulator
MTSINLTAYLVDDEMLALKRLTRLLSAVPGIEIVGSATDPATAVEFLNSRTVDVLFLDIQMPGMNGFELLSKLHNQPMVIFTTAYDHYALRAFEVNSIDYLLKPIEPEQLKRSLRKLENLRSTGASLEASKQLQSVLQKLAVSLSAPERESLDRISSRVGEKIQFIELSKITHFFAEDKLTFAATESNNHIVDQTIAELEKRLEMKQFVRIHRSTIINLSLVDELHSWFGGRVLVKMKDKNRTELVVARDRVRILKEKLGIV